MTGNRAPGAGRRKGMRTRVLVLVVAVPLVLGACGTDDGDEPGAPTTTAAGSSLDGRTFLSQDVIEDGAPRPLVAGTTVRLTFADGTIGASAGCNSFGGDYALDGTTLRLGPLAGTEIGCEPRLHQQDEWLVAFLGSRPTVELTDDTLTLANDTTTMVLLDREVADPDRPLEGTVWVLDSVIARDAVSTVPSDEPLTLEIVDGRLGAGTGCNALGARVAVGAESITLDEVDMTTAGCANDELRALERHVTEVLTGTVDYRIEAGSLTLTNGDVGLGYRAAEE